MDSSTPGGAPSDERPEYGPNEVPSPAPQSSGSLAHPIFLQTSLQRAPNMNQMRDNASIPLLERQLSLESEELPDTRKRRKLSEYAHLEALHVERSRQEFSHLQRESQRDFDRMDGVDEGLRNSNDSEFATMDENEVDIDIMGDEDNLEDGHFVLQAQWQAQRDSVRKKRKRKSITFGERREPHDDREAFSPSKKSEPRTSPSGVIHTRMNMMLGAQHSRVHTKRAMNMEGVNFEGEDDLGLIVDENGEEVTTREYYKASNVVVSKEEEDEDADILDDSDRPLAPSYPSQNSSSISLATNDPTTPPRVKLVMKRKNSRSSSETPVVARRSSRLHHVDVVEYEYDINDPTNDEISDSVLKTPRALEYVSRRKAAKAPNSDPVKKKKPTPSKALFLTPKPVRHKLDHGIASEADLNEFYLSLQRKDYQKKINQPKGMVPVLFSYQLRAVSWMTERETKLFFRDGVRGGILADEMGLGKTIEMMALIISNPRSKFLRPDSSSTKSGSSNIQSSQPHLFRPITSSSSHIESSYALPSAEANTTAATDKIPTVRPILVCDPWIDPPADCHDSSCTLIVCPDILLSQWREEMARHAPSLVVSTYRGVPNLSPLEIAFDQNGDSIFSTNDVVLCSYETLAREFPYSTKPNVKTRHHIEKNSTPLTKLRWWRVVMDEAQMFSQGASNAGKLLRNLRSINRWAVSGTPVRRDFADLRGLLLFLDTEYAYFKPTHEALAFIRNISWRHQMNQVGDEIIIPPFETHQLDVKFTPLEAYGHFKLAKKMKHAQEMEETNPQPPSADTEAPYSESNPAATSSLTSASFSGEVLSHSHGKYASCPYQVMHEKYLEDKVILANSDRSFLCRSLATSISNEFYSSQLGVCRAYNDIGDAYLAQSKETLRLLKEGCDSPDAKSILQNLVQELAQKAVDCYQHAIDLVTYRVGTPIHAELVHLRTPLFALSPPSAPFSTVWYHTLKGMVDALRALGRNEEAVLLENRAESVRVTALQSQLNSVASARFKFTNIKREISRIVRNRLSFTRGEWWFHALKWIGQNVPDFCQHLRKGVAQNLDTKYSGLRTHTLQLNVASVEDVIDKLDLDLTRMYLQRDEAITLTKTPVPTSGVQLDAFSETLDTTDDSLYIYQTQLMKPRTLQNSLTGQGFSVPILNLAERLLLYIEYIITDRYNIIIQVYQFHPDQVSAEEEATMFKLGRWISMSEVSFRELELMKIEVEQAQAYNRVKRDFASSLGDLEESAMPKLQVWETKKAIKDDEDSVEEEKPGTAKPSQTENATMDTDESAEDKKLNEMQVAEVVDQTSEIAVASSTVAPDLENHHSKFEAQLARLRENLGKALRKCLSCKHQLEFVLETGREKMPRYEAFGSKIGVLFNKLIEVLQDSEEQVQNPALLRNKALVFSKWSEPLMQVSHLLKEHGIQYHFGKDAGGTGNKNAAALVQRLAEFRDDPDIRVLFLNSRSQSTGLTLTQANHVFILEDLESAHELQAIGRAHRIGQTRPTHIWKFSTQPGEVPDFSGNLDHLMC